MHGANDFQLSNAFVAHFPLHQEIGYHTDDFSLVGQDFIGQYAH
jgi:hypothetical protein